MDETLIFPSPNWFSNSNLAVSTDGWLVYGGPSKSICVLEPIRQDGLVISGDQSYQAHVAPRAHQEKVVCVDLSPEFPVKRTFISGGDDGVVKRWILEKNKDKYKIKSIHSHKIHYKESENITGVGYSTENIAITVGGLGNIVKWDLIANVCTTYTKFTQRFKISCMACSPHLPLHVAVGTKQGVIFVLDLTGSVGNLVYKVRGHDDEIIHMSWCPQYELVIKKSLVEFIKKSTATKRLEAIRNEVEHDLEVSGSSKLLPEDFDSVTAATKNLESLKKESETIDHLELSGVSKTLPEDSFDETIVEEDDTFDIYKDHEASEFGHKKYEPEDILVKIKEEKSEECDYLAECLKLKEDILKRKNQEEQSIESLVEAMDKTHVNTSTTDGLNVGVAQSSTDCETGENKDASFSVHPHKHLLASISKFGGVRIWSKSGKQVGSCTVIFSNKNSKSKINGWPSLLWYTPDKLLLVDGKSQLLECNPLQIDSKNMITWQVVHALHKRGLYAIATDAPRIQTAFDSPESPFYYENEKWSVYTVAQDRYVVRYSLKSNKALAIHNTCGGFLYNVQSCPYDAGKIAISVGDGAVRVYRSTTKEDNDTKLCPSTVQTYWQNVQGKVLTVAWHPTKENLLAFSTGESRVGLLDTSGKTEKPARTLTPALNGAIYSICWGEGMQLYVCGGGDLVVYNASQPTDAPTPVEVLVEGERWPLASVKWSSRGLLVGSHLGAIALLDPANHHVRAVSFPFTKVIHSLEWHPLQTSNSSEESPYKNLIALCSLEKCHNIILLEVKDKDGDGHELVVWKTLSGHTMPVLQLDWNPHTEELLLSTSQDTTVRVWNIVTGACVSIFGNHSQHTLGATWLAMPQFHTKIVSGGADCCLRLWDINEHKPEHYERIRHDISEKKKTDKKDKKRTNGNSDAEDIEGAQLDSIPKPPSKFLLPIIHRQINHCKFSSLWKMYQKFVDKNAAGEENNPLYTDAFDMDFIKIFGNINEINEVLDMEMKAMLEEQLFEPWMMLSIFRGNIDAMMQLASQHDMITPFLLSIAPCVSFKYWKDVTQMYIAQIDRIIARDEPAKLNDKKYYGGPIYRKVAALLSIHDVKSAVSVLTDNRLFKEAYILCRIRYMDSIAQETLRLWAKHVLYTGNVKLAVICYMALGELSDAATVLAKSTDRESLSLAADLAKLAGRNSFADHMEKKAQTTVQPSKQSTEDLVELPSKMELLMKDMVQNHNDGEIQNDHMASDKVNGDALCAVTPFTKEENESNGEKEVSNNLKTGNENIDVA